MNKKIRFPHIDEYSKEIGLSSEILKEAFNIENYFHKLLINEKSDIVREKLYRDFYKKLLSFYGRTGNEENQKINISKKNRQVILFGAELKNKSVIDFGCGEGSFLMNIQKNIPYKNLLGVDIFIPDSLKRNKKIEFISSSIINFKTENKFDVAFSDNVLEHLSVLDYKQHLKSVYNSLNPGGKFILILPNRLFGPGDITRIIDNSSSGKTLAQGGHLNESTYNEMASFLKKTGFINFQSVLPIPILKYSCLKNFRINIGWIKSVEKNNLLLKFFRKLKIKGRCPIRFTVTIICEKPFIKR